MAVTQDAFSGLKTASSFTVTPGGGAFKKGIYAQCVRLGGHGCSAVAYGGKPLTGLGSGTQGNPHVCHWWLGDISGRSDDTLAFTGAGSYLGFWAVIVVASASGLDLVKAADNEAGGTGGNPTPFTINLNPTPTAALAYVGGINDWNVNAGSEESGQTALIATSDSTGGWQAKHFSREIISGSHNLGYNSFGSATNVALAAIAIAEQAGVAPPTGRPQGLIIG